MKPIEVTLVVYKETPGAIHYKAPNPEGKPVSDVYIRKVHFNGAKPPQRITVLVTEMKVD